MHGKLMFPCVFMGVCERLCECEFAKYEHKFLSKRKMFIMLLLNVYLNLLTHLLEKKITKYVTHSTLRTVTAKTTTKVIIVSTRNNVKPITFYSAFFQFR